MSIKYEIFSYFFSLLINFLFLFIFFSAFHFTKSPENVMKLKIISRSEIVSKLQEESIYTQLKEINQEKKEKLIEKKEETILTKRLTQIKEKVSSYSSVREEYSLSQEELKTLKERMIAFQKAQSQESSKEGSLSENLKEKLGIEYLLLIKRQLENHFEVPIYLRSKKELYALVEIEISPDGKILTYQFLKESPNFEFNKAIERCLKASSPLLINKKAKIIVEFKAEGIGKIK